MKQQIQILALDPALKTGWAHTNGESGVYANPGETYGDRLFRFGVWLHSLLIRYPCDWVVYELAHHRGGAATRLAVGWQAEIERLAFAEGCVTLSCHTSTLKKHATGSGKATKSEMLYAARQQNPTVEIIDDNHCDSLWLLHWATGEAAAAE